MPERFVASSLLVVAASVFVLAFRLPRTHHRTLSLSLREGNALNKRAKGGKV